MRTIPNIAKQLKPLEQILSNEFIPTLFGSNISANERQLLTFPVKYGGLGLRIWHEQAEEAHAISKHITTPLQNQIKAQCTDLPTSDDVAKAKSEGMRAMLDDATNKRSVIIDHQNEDVKRNMEQLSGTGSSSWLSLLPLKEQGFDLNKSEFQDALNLRYDKPLKNMPSKCACGKTL